MHAMINFRIYFQETKCIIYDFCKCETNVILVKMKNVDFRQYKRFWGSHLNTNIFLIQSHLKAWFMH